MENKKLDALIKAAKEIQKKYKIKKISYLSRQTIPALESIKKMKETDLKKIRDDLKQEIKSMNDMEAEFAELHDKKDVGNPRYNELWSKIGGINYSLMDKIEARYNEKIIPLLKNKLKIFENGTKSEKYPFTNDKIRKKIQKLNELATSYVKNLLRKYQNSIYVSSASARELSKLKGIQNDKDDAVKRLSKGLKGDIDKLFESINLEKVKWD